MAKIAILGAGLMGTAFSTPLTDNGYDVHLVGTHLDGDMLEEIHESRVHPRLGTRVSDRVTPYTYDRLDEALAGVEMIVIGVNSLGVEWAAQMLAPYIGSDADSDVGLDVPVLMLTKGLEGNKEALQILPDVLRAGLPAGVQDRVQIAAVGGPSIAGEVAVRRHTCVVLTGTDPALLERIAGYLRTPYYHVWTSTDLVGVEMSVALKNVYALAVGIVGGLLEKERARGKDAAAGKDAGAENDAVMHNQAAAIFAQGLWEIAYLVEVAGGRRESVYSLPGAGDLYVTSMGGRNGRMGRYLGLGMPYTDAKIQHMADVTIEGAELALAIGPTVEMMVMEGKLDKARIPLLRAMIQIVCNDAPVRIPWDDFFAAG